MSSFNTLLGNVTNLTDTLTTRLFGIGSRTVFLAVRVIAEIAAHHKAEARGAAPGELEAFVRGNLTEAENKELAEADWDDILLKGIAFIKAIWKGVHKPKGPQGV